MSSLDLSMMNIDYFQAVSQQSQRYVIVRVLSCYVDVVGFLLYIMGTIYNIKWC